MANNSNNSNATTTTINAGLANLAPEIFGVVAANPKEFAFIFVLNDGEAGAIAEAIGDSVETRVVRRGWGTNVSHVADELAAIQAAEKIPVLIEIAGADQVPGAVVIDHHDKFAGRPSALLQVLHLLGKEPTRWQQLVAANDSGYFAGMEKLGANDEEMAAVRAFDRRYQLANVNGEWVNKFTPEVEAAAEEAIRGMVVKNGVQKMHFQFDATAAITDRLWQTGVPQNILIICETGEIDYFGDWDLCKALQGMQTGTEPAPWDPSQTVPTYDHFGGWVGGQSTVAGRETGFWGQKDVDPEAVEAFVTEWFA